MQTLTIDCTRTASKKACFKVQLIALYLRVIQESLKRNSYDRLLSFRHDELPMIWVGTFERMWLQFHWASSIQKDGETSAIDICPIIGILILNISCFIRKVKLYTIFWPHVLLGQRGHEAETLYGASTSISTKTQSSQNYNDVNDIHTDVFLVGIWKQYNKHTIRIGCHLWVCYGTMIMYENQNMFY